MERPRSYQLTPCFDAAVFCIGVGRHHHAGEQLLAPLLSFPHPQPRQRCRANERASGGRRLPTPSAQKVRPPKQQQAVWTETKSLNAVKSVIRTSISQICYLRALFPEHCFSVTPFAEGINVHALTPAQAVSGSDELECIDDDAWALTRWLEEGVFVALDKQYLKKMSFCIYTDPGKKKLAKKKAVAPAKTLVESYSYEIEYPEAGKAQVKVTCQDRQANKERFAVNRVRAQAVSLVRGLLTMCSTLKPLPTDRILDIEVEFYEDITPREFQLEHFRQASSPDQKQPQARPIVNKSLVITVGEFETPFHSLTLQMQCEEQTIDEAMLSQASNSTQSRVSSSLQAQPNTTQQPSRGMKPPTSGDGGGGGGGGGGSRSSKIDRTQQLSPSMPMPTNDDFDSDADTTLGSAAADSDDDFQPSPPRAPSAKRKYGRAANRGKARPAGRHGAATAAAAPKKREACGPPLRKSRRPTRSSQFKGSYSQGQ